MANAINIPIADGWQLQLGQRVYVIERRGDPIGYPFDVGLMPYARSMWPWKIYVYIINRISVCGREEASLYAADTYAGPLDVQYGGFEPGVLARHNQRTFTEDDFSYDPESESFSMLYYRDVCFTDRETAETVLRGIHDYQRKKLAEMNRQHHCRFKYPF